MAVLADMVGFHDSRLVERFDAYRGTAAAAEAPKLKPQGANFFGVR